MSKMNKIITNNSVQLSESEVNNLIVTLGPVIEAFTGGGGGQGSVIYTPGDDNISINNTQHTIALSTDAATKLNTPIPTKVSDLTDYEDYQTVDKMSAYLTTAQYNSDSAKFATKTELETTAATIMGLIPSTAGLASEAWVTAQGYLTQVPDTYYLKTETSGKDELSAAFDAILNYDVTAAAGIEITTATDNGTTTFGISMTAEPVVTDTNLSGYNGIAAAPDGTKSGWWNIGLTQDMLNTINGKLDSSDFTTYTGTTAPATYQPKGDYATEQYVQGASADVTAWVNNQNYLKTVPSEYITETELSTALTNYVTSSSNTISGTKQYALTTAGWSEITGGGSTFTGVTTASPITGDGLNNTLGLDSNYKTAIEHVSGKVDKPADMTSNIPYCFSGGQWADITQTYYSKTEATGTFLQKNLTNTLSGDGTSDNTLGVNWSNLSGNTIASAEKAGEAQGFRWGDNSYQDTSAALTDLWHSKNHVTLQTADNILTVDNNDNTSATLSAMSYVNNNNHVGWLPQKSCVCQESEIYGMSELAGGQGMLFFVVSAH